MEEKIMNILEQLVGEVKTINKRLDNMDSDIKDLKQGQAYMQNDIKELKQGQERTESKIDSIQKHLIELDSKNADRYVVINGKLDALAKDITVVEGVAGKNMVDIANIKLVK